VISPNINKCLFYENIRGKKTTVGCLAELKEILGVSLSSKLIAKLFSLPAIFSSIDLFRFF